MKKHTARSTVLILVAFSGLAAPAQALITVFAHTHWSGNGGGAPPTPGIWDNNVSAPPGRFATALSQNVAPLQAGGGANSASGSVMARADANGVHARVMTTAQSTGNAAVISRAGNTAGTVNDLFNPVAGENGAGALARLVGEGCIIGNTNVANFLTAMNFKLNGPVNGGEMNIGDTSVVTIAIGVKVEQQAVQNGPYVSLLDQTGSATANFAVAGPPVYTTSGLLTGYTGQVGFAIKSPSFTLSTNMSHLMRITLTMAVAGMADPGTTGSAGNVVDYSNTFGFDPSVGVLDDLPNDLGGATFDAPDLGVSGNTFTPIPEPSGLFLLAIGSVAVLRRRAGNRLSQ